MNKPRITKTRITKVQNYILCYTFRPLLARCTRQYFRLFSLFYILPGMCERVTEKPERTLYGACGVLQHFISMAAGQLNVSLHRLHARQRHDSCCHKSFRNPFRTSQRTSASCHNSPSLVPDDVITPHAVQTDVTARPRPPSTHQHQWNVLSPKQSAITCEREVDGEDLSVSFNQHTASGREGGRDGGITYPAHLQSQYLDNVM